MAENWIVVANNSKARIFTLAPPAPRLKHPEAPPARLVEVAKLDHPEGRLKSQSIDADRPGRSFESAGMKRHAMSREVDPKKQAAIAFAKEVAERLELALHQGELDHLVLVAAPEFLGLLRDNMTADLGARIEKELNLNIVEMTAEEILTHLPEGLFSAPAK